MSPSLRCLLLCLGILLPLSFAAKVKVLPTPACGALTRVSIKQNSTGIVQCNNEECPSIVMHSAVYQEACKGVDCENSLSYCDGLFTRTDVFALLSRFCDDRKICRLSASVTDLMDPCPGKPLKLSITYKCNEWTKADRAPVRAAEIPFDGSRTIECLDDSSLYIVGAQYVPMPHSTGAGCETAAIPVVNNGNIFVNTMKTRCDGRTKCTLDTQDYVGALEQPRLLISYTCHEYSSPVGQITVEVPSTEGASAELTCQSFAPNILVVSAVYIEEYEENRGECRLKETPCQMDASYAYRLTCNGKASCKVTVPDDVRQRGKVLCEDRPMRLLINYACKQEGISGFSSSFGTPGACSGKKNSAYCLDSF